MNTIYLSSVPFRTTGRKAKPIFELCNVLFQLTNRYSRHETLNSFDMAKNRLKIISLKEKLAEFDVNGIIKDSLNERLNLEDLAMIVKVLDSSTHVKPMLNEASLKKLMIFKLKYKPS